MSGGDERRKTTGGRRTGDRRFSLRLVLGFLLLIVVIQLVNLGVYLHTRQSGPEPAEQAPENLNRIQPDDSIPISADPVVKRIVSQLGQGLDRQPDPVVRITDVRIESATGIGMIIVAARIENQTLQPLERARCVLQLRDPSGVLVYQTTDEISLSSRLENESGPAMGLKFLIDNPPPFEQVHILVESLKFAIEGY